MTNSEIVQSAFDRAGIPTKSLVLRPQGGAVVVKLERNWRQDAAWAKNLVVLLKRDHGIDVVLDGERD